MDRYLQFVLIILGGEMLLSWVMTEYRWIPLLVLITILVSKWGGLV